jgi:hypothetical protein
MSCPTKALDNVNEVIKMKKKNNANEKELAKINPLKRLMYNIKMRVFRWEGDRVDDGAESARIILAAFNQLSKFKLNPIGTEAISGYVEGLDPSSPDLDFEVLLGDKRIAELDTTGSNWTFDVSLIMPVNYYKGKKVKTLSLPTFFVYLMKKELGPIKNCCYWIKGEDVIKCEHHIAYIGGKNQDNYYTNKADWQRGLESLIEELRKIAS